MNKILLLILVVLAVWWLAKGFRRKGVPKSAAEAAPEQIVTCNRCGLCLPQGEAVSEGGKFFCCDEHRRPAD